MPTLQEAIDYLYQVAVVQEAATSTKRLDGLARYCVEQFETRGMPGLEPGVILPGGAREKNWDLAYHCHNKPRLAISLKSILQNLSGTVPNRIDDLIGEVANLQMFSPEIVTGYLIILDVSQDQYSEKHGTTWLGLLSQRLTALTGRAMPAWGVGMIEASCIIQVNFSEKPALLTSQAEVDPFFDTLVAQLNARNP